MVKLNRDTYAWLLARIIPQTNEFRSRVGKVSVARWSNKTHRKHRCRFAARAQAVSDRGFAREAHSSCSSARVRLPIRGRLPIKNKHARLICGRRVVDRKGEKGKNRIAHTVDERPVYYCCVSISFRGPRSRALNRDTCDDQTRISNYIETWARKSL